MKQERIIALRSIGLLSAEKYIEVPKGKALPVGGKRNDLQIESRS